MVVTEWYDETDPPPMGKLFHTEDVDMPWSSIRVGDRVRWVTPNFVKRGQITVIAKRGMKVRFDHDNRDTVIPDAKWYFVQGKLGVANEHLVVISSPPPEFDKSEAVRELQSDEDTVWLTPGEAANIMGTDPKNVRRMIRSGKLKASRVGGRWVIDRDSIP